MNPKWIRESKVTSVWLYGKHDWIFKAH